MKLTYFLSILVWGFSSCITSHKTPVYILPNGYHGSVIIIYNVANTEELQETQNEIIFKIPRSGILKTSSNSSFKATLFPICYFEEVLNENIIPNELDGSYMPKNQVFCTLPSFGKIYPDNKNEEAIEYSLFYVGDSSQIEIAKSQDHKEIIYNSFLKVK